MMIDVMPRLKLNSICFHAWGYYTFPGSKEDETAKT